MFIKKYQPCSTPTTKQRGSILLLAALSAVPITGIMAFGIDTANIGYNKAKLEGAVKIAAVYAGEQLGTGATPAAAAQAAKTFLDAHSNLSSNTTAVSTAITTGTLNTGTGSGVGLEIVKTAKVKLFFGKFIGYSTATISATGTASASGGGGKPVNLMIILDTTASMAGSDTNCGSTQGSATRIECAREGATSILNQLSAITDNVGLAIFPATSTTPGTSVTSSCSPSIIPYMQNHIASDSTSSYSTLVKIENQSIAVGSIPPYAVTGVLNYASSPLVNALTGSSSTSTGCLKTPGGEGTYYAQAIYAAQDQLCKISGSTATNGCAAFATALDKHNQSNAGTTVYTSSGNKQQNIIAILSDGDAGADATKSQIYNTTPTNKIPDIAAINGNTTASASSTFALNQCQQGVIAANAAKTASTRVYSISFVGTANIGNIVNDCSTDTGSIISNGPGSSGTSYFGVNITACQAMAMMAGTTATTAMLDPTKASTNANLAYFYNDGCAASGFGLTNASIVKMLADVGAASTHARIVGNGVLSNRVTQTVI